MGRPSGVLFIDSCKAFDTIDHNILLQKLYAYGVKYSSVNWVNSYLSNRSQVTKLNNCVSSNCAVTCGVPQGSILGQVTVFGTKHQQDRISNINVHFEGTDMEQVQSFKYLGIILEPALTFDDHIHYLKGKLYAKIKLLGQVRGLLDRSTALMVYKTLILPVMDYCDFIYLGTIAQNRETLQKLQNCAFRSILGVDNLARTKDMHASLNMDMLDSRREKHAAIEVFKYLNNLGPESCRQLFTYVQDHHDVNTRASSASTPLLPRLNLTLCQRNI